jgi:O-antigen/teichoic acid export membrane protein
MTAGRRLLRDTLVFGAALGISRGLLFLLLPIYARVFSTADYGAFDFMMSLMRALFVPAVLGIDWSLSLLLRGGNETERRRATSSALVIQGLWGAGVILAAVLMAPELAAALLGNRDDTGLILVTEAYLAVQVVNNFAIAIARWRREAGTYFTLTVGYMACSVAVSVGLVLISHQGVKGALAGLAIGGAAFIPVAAVLVRHALAPRVALGDMLRSFRLGLPFAALNATEFMLPFLLRLALVSVAGLPAVGIFGAANTICLGVILISDAFSAAWAPHTLSREHAEGDTGRVIRLYAFVLIVLTAALALVAEPLVSVLLGGGAFREASEIVGALALANWFKSVRQNAAMPLIALGSTWARAGLNLVPMAVGVTLAYGLMLHFGILGAAWGFAAGEAVGLSLQTIVLQRVYRQVLDSRALACMAATYVALLLLSRAAAPSSPEASIIVPMVLAAAFVGMLRLLRAVRPGELHDMMMAVSGLAASLVRR